MVLEIDGACHTECEVSASAVLDDFNPVGNGLACDITGRPAFTVVEFGFKRAQISISKTSLLAQTIKETWPLRR